MKVLIVLALVAVGYASVLPSPEDVGVTGIIEKTLIPLGDRIRQAEESRGRIVGGQPSLPGVFPYQAGLLISYVGITGTGICGGSLVKADRVVSAAHCWNDGVNQGWRITVVLGSITLFHGGTRVDTSAVAQHPNWSSALVRNDINVIYLPNPIPTSATIAPIALPAGNELIQDFVGTVGIASGFGVTDDGDITLDQFLSHVPLTVITNTVCSLSYPIILQDSHLCTSGLGGTGTCQGDSGGPLAIDSNGTPVLIGVTSFGNARGCDAGRPAAFSRVTSFMNFIYLHTN